MTTEILSNPSIDFAEQMGMGLREDYLIKDYRPPEPCDDDDNSVSESDYLLDVESWGHPGTDLDDEMREALWPITFDYFRFSWDHLGRAASIQFRPHRILAQPIAQSWKIRLNQISVNPENETDISDFLLDGKLPSKPIRGGIIAGGPDYLVIISEPNRRGEPGRLFILR